MKSGSVKPEATWPAGRQLALLLGGLALALLAMAMAADSDRRLGGLIRETGARISALETMRYAGRTQAASLRTASMVADRDSRARERRRLEHALGQFEAARADLNAVSAQARLGTARDELNAAAQSAHSLAANAMDLLGDGTPEAVVGVQISVALAAQDRVLGLLDGLLELQGSLLHRGLVDLLAEMEERRLPVMVLVGALLLAAVLMAVRIARASSTVLPAKVQHTAPDPLTGLPVRLEFERRLAAAVSTAKSARSDLALLFIDLDRLQIINDTCGHAAGDELLRQVAGALEGQVRRGDVLARLGGDEFGIVLERCPADVAARIAQGMREAIEAIRFQWEDTPCGLTASIGMSSACCDKLSAAELLRSADAACHAAKEAGGNQVRVYEKGNGELARRRGEMRWIGRINGALETDRFRIYFQRVAPLSAGEQGDHFELLLRLDEGDGRVVSGGEFLPAAERYNLAPRIDRWVIRTALSWFRNHPEELQRVALCTINLSGQSFCQEGFLRYTIEQLDHFLVPPSKICFEITETAAVASLEQARRFMTVLKGMGCRFALDDFGSGMSSFSYLKNLPVDFLKIDGAFVRDIMVDPVDHVMVKAVNEIGHVMGLQTIAEYAESPDIVQELRLLGVDFAQGYAVGRPSPLDELILPKDAPLPRLVQLG